MISKLLFLLLCVFTVTLVQTKPESRIDPKLSCSSTLNKYANGANGEFQLGLEYLDMSNYMMHDTVALYGFHKLFKKFWLSQLENMQKLRNYQIKRGDLPTLRTTNQLKIRASMEKEGPIHQAKATINAFLKRELDLNDDLIRLAKCSSDINFLKQIERDSRNNRPIPASLERVDPMLSLFLDSNFLPEKVERIKYLADLHTRLERFDIHMRNATHHQHSVIPIGIHLIDKELNEKFT